MTDALDPLAEWRESAPYWGKHAATIRTMFAPLTAALIEEAGIHSGQHVLDVAGGAGEPSLTIAGVVGPSGSVTFTDAIAGMVSNAESEAKRLGVTNIRFHQATADSLPFADSSFDVVVSRLGIMFFADPEAGACEMLRVLKPGCKLAFAVWGRNEANPFSYVVTRVLARHTETAPPLPGSHDAFSFAESGLLAGILARAGASEVRERVLKFHIAAPISTKEFWTLRSETSDTLRSKLTRLSPELRELIEREVLSDLQEFFPHGQMSFPGEMLIVSGTKHLKA